LKYLKIFFDHYKDRGSVSLFFYWCILIIKKTFNYKFDTYSSKKDKKIDIVIPTIAKDFDILSLLLESLCNIEHSINNIYIVSPKNEQIIQFCNKNNLRFVDEVSVNGFGKDKIKYVVDGRDRSGWLFQQLLKISGENFTEMKDYLVVDSDTIYVNKNIFITDDNKYVFLQSGEWHQPYFDAFKKIFGYRAHSNLSLTSHMMIFNHDKLKEMKKELEQKHNIPWYDVYISTSSSTEQSCISDYDTYANWVIKNYPNEVVCVPFYNKSISRKKLDSFEHLEDKYKKFKSISFHSYLD